MTEKYEEESSFHENRVSQCLASLVNHLRNKVNL